MISSELIYVAHGTRGTRGEENLLYSIGRSLINEHRGLVPITARNRKSWRSAANVCVPLNILIKSCR